MTHLLAYLAVYAVLITICAYPWTFASQPPAGPNMGE